MLKIAVTFLVSFVLLAVPPAALADPTQFYLVASGANAANLLVSLVFSNIHRSLPGQALTSISQKSQPVRPGMSLTGSNPPGKFYFDDTGVLRVTPTNPGDIPAHAFISSTPDAQGCTLYGGLAFVVGSSSNKCQRDGTFTLQPNAQLGSKLAFDGGSGFYACGDALDVSLIELICIRKHGKTSYWFSLNRSSGNRNLA